MANKSLNSSSGYFNKEMLAILNKSGEKSKTAPKKTTKKTTKKK